MSTIYSIGHSNHPPERFLDLLQLNGIQLLADVRSQPYSRRFPQYRRRELQAALEKVGVEYLFLGRELGGQPRAPEELFQEGISRLVRLAEKKKVAMMCAEEDPARCHRGLLLAPVLLQRGVGVVHIRGDGRLVQNADMTPQLDLFDLDHHQ